MIKRTPGYWSYGIKSNCGRLSWVILDSNGKEMPSERPLGDVRLYANAPEMYDMLWQCFTYFNDCTTFSNDDKPVFQNAIADLLARIGVNAPEKIPQDLINDIEKLAKEKKRNNEYPEI